ncbi:hypothetical protein I204_04170 [Kwoniella mangroviensis CBS 8886]|nr:hypothetical protein I204_04170 [Kwoniella mangroviensis CBS 8886]
MDIDKSAAPPRPRPRRTVKRCLCISCILLACGIGVFLAVTVFSAAKTTISWFKDPHKALVHNGTITPNLSSSQVVRPLIDLETKFDILFTVYGRIPNDEVEDEKQRKEYQDQIDKDTETDTETYTGNELALSARVGRSPVEIRYLPQERTIYQNVVFRGLTLEDKDVEKTINFDLPLKRFYDHFLYAPDVRAAIALLPQRPSKLDRLDNFTSWKPEEAEFPIRIDDNFIATSSLYPRTEEYAIQWKALEQMTYAFPLIEFFNHGDPCNSTKADSDEDELEEDDLYASIIADVDGHQEPPKPDEENEKSEKVKNVKREKSWMHPHIVTRSHVYVMKETRLLDRKAYDKAHKELRKNACGKGSLGHHVSRFLCSRTYVSNGYWENRFVLNPLEGQKNKELAYGPYIDAIFHAAGPKDVHALPVTRHNCSASNNSTIISEPVLDPEYLPVNYTIRFSSLTPARVGLLNHFVQPKRVSHNASEFEIAHSHNEWEQASGVFGAKKEGTHPIRRLIITTLRTLVAFPILILNLIYWYTRTTTVGINHPAAYISSGGMIINALVSLGQGFKEIDGWSDGVLLVLLSTLEFIPAILQLKVTLPIEMVRNGWWKFNLKRWRWSHNERNSMRRGTGIDPKIWIGIFLSLFSIIYFPNKYSLAILHPSILPPPPIPSESSSAITAIHESPIFAALSRSFEIFALILQISHNAHNSTFAGNYKLTTYMIMGYRVSELVYFVPFIVGTYDLRMGIAYITVIEVAIEGVLVWQAWKLPKIDQKLEEDQNQVGN